MSEWMRIKMYAGLLFNSLIYDQDKILVPNPLF